MLTETLTLVSPNETTPSVREHIEVLARDLGLIIDAVEETPHRSSTQIKITLTGPAHLISDFQDATAGDGLSSTNQNPGDVIITGVLQWVYDRTRRWRRARRERKLVPKRHHTRFAQQPRLMALLLARKGSNQLKFYSRPRPNALRTTPREARALRLANLRSR